MITISNRFWVHEVDDTFKIRRNTCSAEDIKDQLQLTTSSKIRVWSAILNFKIDFEDSRQELLFKLKYSEYIVPC